MQRQLLVLVGLLGSVGAAAAQVPAARDTADPLLLPGLTVSVLRTPIEVNRAPYATAVNTQAEIQRARPGIALDEALRAIPGVQVDNRYNYALGERISVRGFGARAQFGVRGVKVLVDGVPATFPDGQSALSHIDLGFTRRVEVVRGPASAIYGANAGGVIQFESEDAPAGRISQEFGFNVGSDDLLRLQSTTGGRSGNASYVVSLSRLNYEGYRTFNESENTRANVRLGWLAGRNELRLSLGGVDYDAQNPGSLNAALLASQRYRAFANNVNARTGESGRQGQMGLTWRRDLGFGLGELVAYGIAREVDNPIPATVVVLDRRVGGLRGTLNGGGSLLNWAVGAEGHLQDDTRQNYANVRGSRGALALDQDERVTNLGTFAQVTALPTTRLTVIGALRYDWYRFRADDHFITNGDDSGRVPMEHLSPSIGASFAVSEMLNLFGNVATSFETPTTTELANREDGSGGFNPDLEPQEAVSYEIGAKGSLSRRARYDLSLYHTDVSNELIPFESQSSGRSFFRNAGSGTHRGVEASVILAPFRPVTVRGAYTYTDAEFDDYRTASADFSGNKLPGVAPHRGELALTLDALGFFTVLEGRYTSRLAVNDANTFHSPESTVVDGRIALSARRIGGLDFEPYAGITNLLDEEYNTSVVVNAFGSRFFEPGPGRAFYLGANARVGAR